MTEQQKLMQNIGVAMATPKRQLGNVQLDSEQYSFLMERINRSSDQVPRSAMTEQQKLMQKIGVAMATPKRQLGNVQLDSEQYSFLMERINARTNEMLNSLDLEELSNRPNQKMVRRALENRMKNIRKIAGIELQRQYPELREQIRDKKLFERGLLGEED